MYKVLLALAAAVILLLLYLLFSNQNAIAKNDDVDQNKNPFTPED